MKRLLISAVFSLLAWANAAQAVDTIVSVCNHNTDRAVFSTYLLAAGAGAGWQSHGWYKSEAGQCTDINLGMYTGKVFVYSEDQFQETSWGEGTTKYCINKSDAFVMNNADLIDCSDAKFKKVASNEYSVTLGKTTVNIDPNFSTLNFCNQNPAIPVYAALAKVNGAVTSKGWYQIDAGKCKAVSVGKFAGRVWYYGEYNLGQNFWDGSAGQFCVNRASAFSLADADKPSTCTSPTTKMVGAREVTVQAGVTTVNFEALSLETKLKLCNTTPDKLISASYATSTGTLWSSTGWSNMDAQQCIEVSLGKYVGTVNIYAEWNHGQTYWGSGPFNFCVNRTTQFTIADSTNLADCNSNIALKMVPAFSFQVAPGTNTFTFNP